MKSARKRAVLIVLWEKKLVQGNLFQKCRLCTCRCALQLPFSNKKIMMHINTLQLLIFQTYYFLR